MESIAMVDHEDQPTNSSEEVDQQDQDLGSGTRSYECVYCRRGFTTAQALGGHMNIHRKDRAKSRPSNSSSSKQDEYSCYANPRFYKPVFASSPPSYLSVASHQEGQIHYRTYFPSTSSAQPITYENNHQDPNQAITSPSMEEISSSLLLGRSHGEDRDSKRSIQSRNEEDELDLELRLGHDP